MKILIDARLYGLENAGLGRYTLDLISELAKQDHKNEYTILLRKKYFDSLKLPKNWHKILADIRHYTFVEQTKIPRIIKKINPDITHFPHFNVPLLFRGNFIVTIHDMLMHKSVGLAATTLSAPSYFVKRLGYRLVFDNAVRRSKAIIVPSKAVKDELIEKYGTPESKVTVTYEGVDAKIINKQPVKMPKPCFVYTGNAYPHKNLSNLVTAIKLLNNKSRQPVFLALASSRNIFTQRLQKLTKKLNAEKFVRLLGFVPDEKLGSLYENSAGFVAPSLSEGFGLPGLEALSVGTPLAASDIPVFKEIYSNNAIYFDPHDPNSIASAMEKVVDLSDKDRKMMIDKGKSFVKRYSWDKMAKQTLRIYEDCNSLRQSK